MTFSRFIELGLSYYFRTDTYVAEHGIVLSMFFILVFALLSCAAGYFCGSVNTAVLVSKKIFGTDIREKGSGNAGMTNMFRVFGKSAGLLTLGGDLAKTAVAVGCGYVFLGYSGAWLAGFFCVLGHMFPCFSGFRGGKGVLCAAAVLLLTDWPVALISILVFAAMLVCTRMVSAASLMAAFTMPLFLNLVYRVFYGEGAVAGVRLPLAIGIMLLVVFGHRENIRRIRDRSEPKIRLPWDKK